MSTSLSAAELSVVTNSFTTLAATDKEVDIKLTSDVNTEAELIGVEIGDVTQGGSDPNFTYTSAYDQHIIKVKLGGVAAKRLWLAMPILFLQLL